MKRCCHCRQMKDKDQFSRHTCRPDGLRDYCKDCHKIARKDWEKKNPDKVRMYARRKARRKYYMSTYGLTVEERETLFEENGQRCEVCEGTESLVIDHCHKTGKVRGVLCGSCNLALGFLKDKPSLAFKAGLYLLGKL
jgi:hypothetical protein